MGKTWLGIIVGSLLLTVAAGAGAQEISDELANRIGEAAEQMQNFGVNGAEDSLPMALEIGTWYGLSDSGWYEGWDFLRDGREARERIREGGRTRLGALLPGLEVRPAQTRGISCGEKNVKMANATRVVAALDQLAGLWTAWAGWYRFTGMPSRFTNPVGIGVIVLAELSLTARQYRELINAQPCWTMGDGRWDVPKSTKG